MTQTGKTNVLGKNLYHCHSVHHRVNTEESGNESGSLW